MSMDEERHPAERIASAIGKTPAEIAAVDRCLAGLREMAVARFKLNVSAENAARHLGNLVSMLRESDRRIAITEGAEIAAHPDLVYLNVQFDGFYDAPA